MIEHISDTSIITAWATIPAHKRLTDRLRILRALDEAYETLIDDPTHNGIHKFQDAIDNILTGERDLLEAQLSALFGNDPKKGT